MPGLPKIDVCQWCETELVSIRKGAKYCDHKCAGKAIADRRRKAGRVRQTCSESDCDRPAHGGGLCHAHYRRLRDYGRVHKIKKMRPRSMPVREWFFTQIEKADTCWIWKGNVAHKRGGYGTFWDGERKLKAHHYLVGRPERGMVYHHTCHNPLCVNPDHLKLMSNSDHRKLHEAEKRKSRAGE